MADPYIQGDSPFQERERYGNNIKDKIHTKQSKLEPQRETFTVNQNLTRKRMLPKPIKEE